VHHLLLFLIVITPGISIAIYVYLLDKHEPEPIRLMMLSFGLGILALFLDLLVGIPLETLLNIHEHDLQDEALHAFVLVAFTEELLKFIFIRGILYPNKNFNEPLDGIIYATMVGMGFATAENLIYVVNAGIGAGLVRMITAIPAHALFAVIMGYYLGLSKFHATKPWVYGFVALGVSTLLHGIYDYFIFISFIPFIWMLSALCLVVAFFMAKRAIRIHEQASPFKKSDL